MRSERSLRSILDWAEARDAASISIIRINRKKTKSNGANRWQQTANQERDDRQGGDRWPMRPFHCRDCLIQSIKPIQQATCQFRELEKSVRVTMYVRRCLAATTRS